MDRHSKKDDIYRNCLLRVMFEKHFQFLNVDARENE